MNKNEIYKKAILVGDGILDALSRKRDGEWQDGEWDVFEYLGHGGVVEGRAWTQKFAKYIEDYGYYYELRQSGKEELEWELEIARITTDGRYTFLESYCFSLENTIEEIIALIVMEKL